MIFFAQGFHEQIENILSVFLFSFTINLQAFYHEFRSVIDYATQYLFCRTE